MSEYLENPLYQEVLANPHELEPRLVLADWLEEHGDQRCDVIRMQIRLENMKPGERGYSTLKTKASKLFKKVGGFGSVRGITSCKEEYRSGFVDRIELTPTRFLKNAAALFSTAPIRRIKFKGICKSFDKIGNLQYLPQICGIEMRNSRIDDRNFRAFVHSPYLTSLKSFSVYSDELNSAGKDLSQTNLLDHLDTLNVSGRFIHDNSIAFIADRAVGLKDLVIWGSLSDESLSSIGGASGMTSLTSLELGSPWVTGSEFTEIALSRFGESESVQPLETFAIRGGRPGFGNALDRPRFSEINAFTISATPVSDGDFQSILNHLKNLNYLDLSYTDVSDEAMNALARSPTLANLQKVYLSGNRISKKGIDAILDSEFFNKSTKFYFNGNALNRSDIDAIKTRAGKTFGNFSRDSGHWYYQ